MTVMAPKNKWELADMMRFAVRLEAPVAVRYPRGTAFDGFKEQRDPVIYGKSEAVYEEEDIAILSVGHMFETAVKVRDKLKETGYNCSLINARFVKPIDEKMILELAKDHHLIVTIEENVMSGGYGEKVMEFVEKKSLDVKVLNLALPDDYIEHGSVDVLRKEVMLDANSISTRIMIEYIAEETRRGHRE